MIAASNENICRFKLKSLISKSNRSILINIRCEHYRTLSSMKKKSFGDRSFLRFLFWFGFFLCVCVVFCFVLFFLEKA